jgi:hypothetical protein
MSPNIKQRVISWMRTRRDVAFSAAEISRELRAKVRTVAVILDRESRKEGPLWRVGCLGPRGGMVYSYSASCTIGVYMGQPPPHQGAPRPPRVRRLLRWDVVGWLGARTGWHTARQVQIGLGATTRSHREIVRRALERAVSRGSVTSTPGERPRRYCRRLVPGV